MSVKLDTRKRIYDLYSFDAPYDIESKGLMDFVTGYQEDSDLRKDSALAHFDDDELAGLDLTLEEAEPNHHMPASGLRLTSSKAQRDSRLLSTSVTLGATLSQRKKLLKEHVEELKADIRKREKLEEQLIEKSDIETTGLEFLLGNVKDFGLGNYPSVDMRKTNLETQILSLKKLGWDEQLRCWRDIVALKKELREVLEEYHLILSAEGL